MGLKTFCGEVWTNIHPVLLEAMVEANRQPVDGKVGNDSASRQTLNWMQSFFRDPVFTVSTFNGTAANILALKSMLKPWGCVLSAECTHVNTHECGATEYQLGNKILSISSEDGKLSPERIETYLKTVQNYKYIPQVLVITQPTELGVLYSTEELRALCEFAHSKQIAVYLDGARIAHALSALNTDLQTMIADTGIDAFSFGGTKAGMMFGELVVFLRPEFAEHLDYSQKQSLQHMDKSKFLGVQFETLFRTELWKETASHSNQMAKLLEEKLAERGIFSAFPVDTNMVFCCLSEEQYQKITAVHDLHYWDESIRLVRFAATHETTPEMIQELVALLD